MTRACGTKQVLKAVSGGKAQKVYLAQDADRPIFAKITAACKAQNVPIEPVESKAALGQMFGIAVASAAAVEIAD